MKHKYPNKSLFAVIATLLTASACVNSDYDLGNINMKITLSPNGVTLPLGKVEKRVDSLIRNSEIDDLVIDDGVYAYKLTDVINEKIDAISINPIRNVIPAIDPYRFNFTEGSLPTSFAVKGFNSDVTVDTPAFGFTNQPLRSVSVTKPINISDVIGTSLPDGMEISLPQLNEDEDFSFSLSQMPDEVAAVERLYFSGATQGTPIRVRFSLGALATSIKSGRISLNLTLPQTYTLRLDSNYGGTATVSGNQVSINNYPASATDTEFVFYIAERQVTEHISASRILELQDNIVYDFQYTGISNGNPIRQGQSPTFALNVSPEIEDALIVTTNITPDPIQNTSDIAFAIENMEGITRVDYIAFTNSPANAMTLQASNPGLPLRGEVEVKITFPRMLQFASGITGMSDNVLTTTLDKLSAGSIVLPLRGVRPEGNDAIVTNGKLSINKPIVSIVSPDFPSGRYKLSELENNGDVQIGISASNMNLHLNTTECQFAVSFSEAIDIRQQINESFEVPDEVGGITFAQVLDADNNGDAILEIKLNIQDSPVDLCNFDNIDIVLPAFLKVEHPNLDAASNTIHIDRVAYTGHAVTIARITLKGLRNVPIIKGASGRSAQLKGEVRILATAVVPDNTEINGMEQTQITLLPQVSVSPLKISHVTGKVNLDLQEYLKPTTIDLKDIRESLGDQNIEINLVAPQITLAVSNPVGIEMIGNIVLQPYDFEDKKLDPVTVKNVRIEPSKDRNPHTTKLFITEGTKAPEGYTLCQVEDLSKIVKIIPSKIDITFAMEVDDTREQSFFITGNDYPLNVDYTIKLPLKFKDNAQINYSDIIDVDTFDDIDKYDITADDILVTIKARTTLPLDLGITMELLDTNEKVVEDVTATVTGKIEGYNAQTDGDSKESSLEVLLNIKDGDIQRLKPIAKIRYKLTGSAVGKEAGLKPEQYVSANLKLRLKKGITIDLNSIGSDK